MYIYVVSICKHMRYRACNLLMIVNFFMCNFVCLFLSDCCIFFLYFEYDLYDKIINKRLSTYCLVALPPGVRRFYDNIELMLGYRINPWLMACWTVITPLLTAVRTIYIVYVLNLSLCRLNWSDLLVKFKQITV